MERRWICLAAATGLALAIAGCARKDDGAKSGSRTAIPGPYYNFNPADRDFVNAAAEFNHAEVDAGRLALGRAIHPGVRTFAQKLIEDHEKIDADLTELAKKKGVSLPVEADEEHKKAVARLAELGGPEFDRAFAATMPGDQATAVALFEELLRKGRDPEVRAFAEKTIPTLRKHLELARDLRLKVLGSTSPN